MSQVAADILIVGAGIVGLSIAREINNRNPGLKVLLLEKEAETGKHASGRNSGVVHTGLYYPPDSLKARVCVSGAREMLAYCKEHGLPINPLGKVIVPGTLEEDAVLDMLYQRAVDNGVRVELVDEQQLHDLEPQARSASGRALYSPDTAVVDPKAVLSTLLQELAQKNATILYGQVVREINIETSTLTTNQGKFSFGYLVNCAGLYADKIAVMSGLKTDYAILPFRGTYYELADSAGIRINRLIYPVPDLRVPFLGIHFTNSVSGKTYVGPSALPVLGRENYSGMQGARLQEALEILPLLAKQYMANKQGFRLLAKEEARRLSRKNFARAAKLLVPAIREDFLLPGGKVGIRAQLVDTRKKELMMDFVVERHQQSVHVLNAISPAFTSAFAFAGFIVDQFFSKEAIHGS